jgi:regulator of sigma E protease
MQVVLHPLVPLGGYVKIKGSEPKADGSETQIADGFYGRGLGSRAIVLAAGPAFSILGGYLLFFGSYAGFGKPEGSNEPVIGEVVEGRPAAKAGLKAGDRILQANSIAIGDFGELRKVITSSADKSLTLVIERQGNKQTITATPSLDKDARVFDDNGEPLSNPDGSPKTVPQGVLGIAPEFVFKPVSFGVAASLAAQETWHIIAETGRILSRPSELKENAGGVISIATATSRAASEGLMPYMRLAAIISISLGILNMLPIPLMDGGQLLVALIEWLRGGKRLSLRTQEAMLSVGLLIIFAIFLSVTYLDIGRILRPN